MKKERPLNTVRSTRHAPKTISPLLWRHDGPRALEHLNPLCNLHLPAELASSALWTELWFMNSHTWTSSVISLPSFATGVMSSRRRCEEASDKLTVPSPSLSAPVLAWQWLHSVLSFYGGMGGVVPAFSFIFPPSIKDSLINTRPDSILYILNISISIISHIMSSFMCVVLSVPQYRKPIEFFYDFNNEHQWADLNRVSVNCFYSHHCADKREYLLMPSPPTVL